MGGSAEIIAVSSILTYDIYYTYIHPELKNWREALRKVFYDTAGETERVPLAEIQSLLQRLVKARFFEKAPTSEEVVHLVAAINGYADGSSIAAADLYDALNRSVASNSIEGPILLRVSKFFTFVFALFMGFLAICLQQAGLSLGWVYMSMGVFIGSAVGPASFAILMERANGTFIALGAVGGLVLGVLAWTLQAKSEFGEITIETLGKDLPFVAGNVAAIGGGLLIALGGSLIFPDTTFKWEMLNQRIPLVDDIEPPKEAEETDEKLQRQVKVAVTASIFLTVVLLILWPLPMHFGVGVFSSERSTVWVAVEILWALVGGVTIIVLPVAETIRDAISSKKLIDEAQSGKLKDGTSLTIDVELMKGDSDASSSTRGGGDA